jgi:hypothetical protein
MSLTLPELMDLMDELAIPVLVFGDEIEEVAELYGVDDPKPPAFGGTYEEPRYER